MVKYLLGGNMGVLKKNYTQNDTWIKIVDVSMGMGNMIIQSVSFVNQAPTIFAISFAILNSQPLITTKLLCGDWNYADNNEYLFDIRYKLDGENLKIWIKDHIQGGVTIFYNSFTPTWIPENIPSGTTHPSTDDVNLLSFNSIVQNNLNLTRLASALGDSYLEIASNSFSSLQGKNCVFKWINDTVSTPFCNEQTTLMGRCYTSLDDTQYTTIEIWHIATANLVYRGIMINGSVAAWYQYDLQQV